jgi:hypothetical protein
MSTPRYNNSNRKRSHSFLEKGPGGTGPDNATVPNKAEFNGPAAVTYEWR